jgi:NTP pyrophosphatase (non-canonical NTP hydrolase)
MIAEEMKPEGKKERKKKRAPKSDVVILIEETCE